MSKPPRYHFIYGKLEECTVVDPGPSRMGACLICGAVYLQEDKLKELQMYHNVGQRISVEVVKRAAEGLWSNRPPPWWKFWARRGEQ